MGWKINVPVEEPINLAKEAGISVVRFPGGCGAHLYDWEKAVSRKENIFQKIIEMGKCEKICRERVKY